MGSFYALSENNPTKILAKIPGVPVVTAFFSFFCSEGAGTWHSQNSQIFSSSNGVIQKMNSR
jgi:hypothetical protein